VKLADLGPVRRAGQEILGGVYETAVAARQAVLSAEDLGSTQRWVRLRQARTALDAAVRGIRAVDPGFGRPLRWEGIAAVSATVPILYLAPCPAEGLGLLVQHGNVVPIAGLEPLTAAAARESLTRWRKLYGAVGSEAKTAGREMSLWERLLRRGQKDESADREAWKGELERTLGALWDMAMGPVVAVLRERSIARVVVIGCGELAGLPLHLAWSETGGSRHYAMSALVIQQAPSVRLLAEAQHLRPAKPQRVLAILDDREGEGFPAAAARAEQALQVHFGSRLLPVLKGAAATASAVSENLWQADIVYFLGHGRAARGEDEETTLALPSGEMLRLSEIETLRLNQRLWMIVACEGAHGGPLPPTEAHSIAGMLLQAGVGGVVAAPWVIDARFAVPVSLAAMGEIARGVEAAEALLTAQRRQAAGELAAIPGGPMLGRAVRRLPEDNPQNPALWALQYLGG